MTKTYEGLEVRTNDSMDILFGIFAQAEILVHEYSVIEINDGKIDFTKCYLTDPAYIETFIEKVSRFQAVVIEKHPSIIKDYKTSFNEDRWMDIYEAVEGWVLYARKQMSVNPYYSENKEAVLINIKEMEDQNATWLELVKTSFLG